MSAAPKPKCCGRWEGPRRARECALGHHGEETVGALSCSCPCHSEPDSAFERLGLDLGRLVAEKNLAYGDSFARSGEIMAILYPQGIRPNQYRDALGVVRVIDKLFRVATRKDAFGETPWRDIAGYGIVAAAADERDKAA